MPHKKRSKSSKRTWAKAIAIIVVPVVVIFTAIQLWSANADETDSREDSFPVLISSTVWSDVEVRILGIDDSTAKAIELIIPYDQKYPNTIVFLSSETHLPVEQMISLGSVETAGTYLFEIENHWYKFNDTYLIFYDAIADVESLLIKI